jgi:3-oxoacyl-[acyl-carrier protein] reductase
VIDRDGDGIRADLSDLAATAPVFEEALRDGPITRLVNNVDIMRRLGAVEDQTIAGREAMVSPNLRCALRCFQALSPRVWRRFGLSDSTCTASREYGPTREATR